MAPKRTPVKKHVVHHQNGSIWAKGQKAGDVCVGYWEWFRLDGTRMRSGYFDNDVQVGEWITYDKKGKTVKVTNFKKKKKGS